MSLVLLHFINFFNLSKVSILFDQDYSYKKKKKKNLKQLVKVFIIIILKIEILKYIGVENLIMLKL